MTRKVKATDKQLAGKKGGRSTLKKHGAEFYARIGAKGGRERARRLREAGGSTP